jgi:hypothetical protein
MEFKEERSINVSLENVYLDSEEGFTIEKKKKIFQLALSDNNSIDLTIIYRQLYAEIYNELREEFKKDLMMINEKLDNHEKTKNVPFEFRNYYPDETITRSINVNSGVMAEFSRKARQKGMKIQEALSEALYLFIKHYM